jgi:hypothetical protein
MMIGYDIYDRFTMEHFPLCQSLILTTSFFLLATVTRFYVFLNQKTLIFNFFHQITKQIQEVIKLVMTKAELLHGCVA